MGDRPMMACGHAANAMNTATGEPSCAICVGLKPGAETVATQPDLTGRMAKCSCGRKEPSSTALAFFEYVGPGSRDARESCVCGYAQCAHDPEYMARNVPSNRRTVIEDGRCKAGVFTPRGPREFDRYYCGCRGWD